MDPELATYWGVMPGTTIAVDPSSAMASAGSFGLASGSGTGQQGITPTGGMGGTVSNAVNRVWQWLNAPFTTNMSPIDVGLLVGTVIIAILVWNLILYHLRIAAESL